jgi:hypothetical protein
MPAILRRLPFLDRLTTVTVQGRAYPVASLQIILWVSLGPKGVHDLAPSTPRFPAVLDPAFTDNLIIHRDQLRQFAGFIPQHLRPLNSFLRPPGRQIPLHAANLWIHPNQPGERDVFSGASPFRLELHRGIGIWGGEDGYPRLPLLGARALRQAELQLWIDYRKCRVSLRTPRRFWLFG